MYTQDVNLTLRKTEGKAYENSELYFQIFYTFKLITDLIAKKYNLKYILKMHTTVVQTL